MKQKAERYQTLNERENRSISSLTEKCLLSSSASSEDITVSDLEILSETSKAQPPQRRARKYIINSHLAACHHVSKLNDRKAAAVVGSTLKSIGCDPSEFNVNRYSIRR